jgi:hypothetical protein
MNNDYEEVTEHPLYAPLLWGNFAVTMTNMLSALFIYRSEDSEKAAIFVMQISGVSALFLTIVIGGALGPRLRRR